MTKEQPERSGPVGKKVFLIMALATVAMGVAMFAFHEWWGLEREVAALIGAAFLLVGAVDLIILKKWDRIFAPKSDGNQR